ncbi:hypothetical protein GCM10009117_13080 [Gangjinia marincola]|uniref:DUF4412 domain-containing protein n=1 Tax=Gangjinia marincola TaxID=578463 RepID=A0ABN1MGD5_9FLAO
MKKFNLILFIFLATFGQLSAQDDDDGISAMMQSMMGGNVEIEDSYAFDYMVTTIMKEYKKGKVKSSQQMSTFLSDEATYTTMSEDSHMVHDFKNESAIMIDVKKNTAMTMSTKMMKKMMNKVIDKYEVEIEDETVTHEVTDETRKIGDYNCIKHIFSNTESNEKMHLWITKDLDFDFQQLKEDLAEGMGFGNLAITFPMLEGAVIETEMFDKKGQKKYVTTVVELGKTNKTLSMSDYKVTNMFGG